MNAKKNAKAVYIIWLRGVKQSLRQRLGFISNLAFPLLMLFFMGTGLKGSVNMENMGLIGSSDSTIDYMDFLLPGIIGMNLLFSSTFGGISILEDKKFGFLKEILVAPVSRVSIVIGITLASTTISALQGIVIIVAAPLIDIDLNFFHIPLVLLFIFIVGMAFTSFGVAIATQLEDIRALQSIESFLMFPLLFMSGAFFPITELPSGIQTLAYINPLFYGVDGMRGALLGAGTSTLPMWIDLFVVTAFCAILILLGAYLFNKSEGI